ncbi:hypothetical protein KFE25_012617 [Diacronema lutheri]|uniref:Uncharacterized protein n=1 Tax=Diacronema lutheri TaxID=2081491 RepID=A0A8J5XLC6_DIALT|nr:hypothetical protein KFE25_012617 [Diacronema lutheri]
MLPGDLVQLGSRLALVVGRDGKRLHVQYESDGALVHIAAKNAARLQAATADELGDARLRVGAAVRARAGAEDGNGPGEWVDAMIHTILRADAIDDSPPGSAAGPRLAPALRFGVRFPDGREAWRRPSEVECAGALGSGSPRATQADVRVAHALPAIGDAPTAPFVSPSRAAKPSGTGDARAGSSSRDAGGAQAHADGVAPATRSDGRARAHALSSHGTRGAGAESDAGTSAAADGGAPEALVAAAAAAAGAGGAREAAPAGAAAPPAGARARGRARGREPSAPHAPGVRAFNIGGMAALPGEGGVGAADASDPPAKEEGWCGPWSTARKMLREQPAAQEARKRELEEAEARANAEGAAHEPWLPAKRSRAGSSVVAVGGSTFVPSLQSLCTALIAAHCSCVSSLGVLPMGVLNALQAALARRRALTPEAAALFADPEGCVTEFVLDDCCLLTEADLMGLLARLGESRTPLSVLCLGSAGRALAGSAARQLTELAAGEDARLLVEHLSVGGAYRLDAPSLCALLGAPAVGARLRTLQLTYNPLVSGAVVGAISAHCRELSSLALDHCAALDDEALAPLAALRGLTELSLVGLPLLTPDGLVGLLTTPPLDAPASGAAASGAAAAPSQPCAALGARLELLSLAENEQMTDEALIAIAAHCASCLHTLDLSGLHRLTDDGVGACVLQGAALRCVRLRGICALSDEPVRELADRRGAALCELSLNGCAQISNETVRALEAQCSSGLVALDLSWCRRVTDDALGRLADACVLRGYWGAEHANRPFDGPGGRPLLPALKLWGMSQLSAKFHHGHSLAAGVIEGTPECKQLQVGHVRAGWSVRTRQAHA